MGALGVLGNMAFLYSSKKQFDSAAAIYERIFPAMQESVPMNTLLNTRLQLSTVYMNMDEFTKAAHLLNENITIAKSLHDSAQVAQALMNLGYLFEKQMRYKEQLETAHGIFKEVPKLLENPCFNAKLNLLLGNAHYHLYNLDSANFFYEKCQKSADGCYNESLAIESLQSLGRLAERAGNYERARSLLGSATGHWKTYGDYSEYTLALLDLGHLFWRSGQPDSVVYFLGQGVTYINSELKVFKQMDYLNLLANAYAQLEQHDSGFVYKSRSMKLQDSLQSRLRLSLQWEVDIANKDRELKGAEIANLEKDKKLMNSIIIIILVILVAAVIIGRLLFTRQKNKRLVAEKDHEIQKARIDDLLKDQELSSIMSVIEIQEKERKRIAQDLHDRLGGMLTVIKLHFKKTEKNIKLLEEQNKEGYEKASTLLDEATEEVRKIAFDLVSGVLKNFGLAAALNDLKKTVENTGQLKMEVVTNGLDERLSWNYELNIYRVIQELLANVLKHAEATEITIQILKKDEHLDMIFEDDGRGFDPDVVNRGMGLKNIDARITHLSGDFNLDTGKGGGTTYTFHIPLEEETDDKSNIG